MVRPDWGLCAGRIGVIVGGTTGERQRVYDWLALAAVLVGFSKRLGATFWTRALERARISGPDSQVKANSASSRASLNFSRRIRYLICGTFGGATLNSSTPRPSNSGVMIGSPAISPHTPTQMPW